MASILVMSIPSNSVDCSLYGKLTVIFHQDGHKFILESSVGQPIPPGIFSHINANDRLINLDHHFKAAFFNFIDIDRPHGGTIGKD